MIKYIKILYNKSEFIQNIFTLVSGTILAQIISLITIPFLYRIYSIEDYGILGVFVAITSILSILSTLQYNSAIILEDKEEDALKILKSIQYFNLGFSIFIGISVSMLIEPIVNILGASLLSDWLYLVPFSVFFLGQMQLLRIWANRQKEYKLIRLNTILLSLIIPFVSLIFGVVFDGWIVGLFLGLLLGQVIPTVVFYKALFGKKEKKAIRLVYSEIKELAMKYKNFPKFSLPSEFISTFSHQLPIFMLSSLYGTGVVGLYDLSIKVLGLPSTLVSGAIKEVYKEKASKEYNKHGTIKNIFLKTFKPLVLISIIGFGILAILSPFLFELIFGVSKREAGNIAQIMTLVYALRFINSPLTFGFDIKGQQHIGLLGSIWFIITTIIVFSLCKYYQVDYMNSLFYFAINFCCLYLVMMTYNYKISTK